MDNTGQEHYWIRGPLVLTEECLDFLCLEIKQGKIVQIAKQIPEVYLDSNLKNTKIVDFSSELYLIPGFIDLHIHGAMGFDVMDGSIEALDQISQALVKEGTTAYLATTMTESESKISQALKNIAEFKKNYKNKNYENNKIIGAEILGVHLEGPFISPSRMGAQNPEFIKNPDINLFKKFQDLSEDQIKLVTVAPEVCGASEFIKYLCQMGVVVSIGHSDANFSESKKAIDSGVSHCTHLYNAMSSFHHRNPGVVVAVLGDDRVRAELIADGIHVDPAVLALTLKIKTPDKLLLVTDAMRAKCLSDGEYDLGGQKVFVKSGAARLASGVLAGSVLTLNKAFSNIQDYTGCSLQEAVKMASENPAKQLGIFDQKGSIKINKDADLVLIDQAGRIHATFCHGQLVYLLKQENKRSF